MCQPGKDALFTFSVLVNFITFTQSSRNFIVGLCARNLDPERTYRNFDALTSASATTIAFEDLYLNGILSRDITVSVIWSNAYEMNEGAGAVVNLIVKQNADVIIGSPMSEVIKPMAHFTTYWNLPHLSWSATSPDLTDKETFKTLVRTLAPFNSFGKGFIKLFRAFKWKRTGIIYDTRSTAKYAADAILQHFSRTDIYIAEVVLVDGTMTDITIEKALLQLKRTVRIIILSVYNRRSFMVKACDVGMCNGNYVFINPSYISTKTNIREWQIGDDRARTAFKHFLKVTYATWSSEAHAKKVAELRTLVPIKMAELPFNSSFALDRNYTGDFFVPYLYAAAYTYGVWLNYSITNNINPRDGLRFRQYAPDITFDGIESQVSYNQNGDRESQFWIMDFTEPDASSRILALIDESKPQNEALTIWKHFNWQTADNTPPMDAPVCGFHDELCPEDNDDYNTMTITLCGVCVFIFVITVVGFKIRKKQIEIATLNTLWKIDYSEIVFSNSNHCISFRGLKSCPSITSCKTNDSQVIYRFTKHGAYRGQVVAIKPAKCDVNLTRDEKITLLKMMQINYDNVNQFVGGCLEHPNACVLFTYCERGSLLDILEDDNIKIDWMFKLSFIRDIIKGMMHIQSSRLKSHGRLKSSNCVIDKRWILKITDYGIANFMKPHSKAGINDSAEYTSLLWTAPELLRQDQPPANGTQPGDVYSFGIILHEIIYRDGTFPAPMLTPKGVVERVSEGSTPPFRPEIPGGVKDVNQTTVEFMRNCWAEHPEYRPTFSAAKSHMRKTYREMNGNLIDTVLKKLETYANNLESLVDHRTAELVEEKKKTEKLLYQMLPRVVAEKLKSGGKVAPEVYESVSIFFSDIVGFTQISALSSPIEIVDLLNDLYTLFDDIIAQHEVYKVETIGDAYMVASGLPSRNGIQHAVETSEMSLNFITALNGFCIKHMPKKQLMIRIGLHTGSCCAGIVGMTMPRYCLFGDTVNTASRMESNGEAQKIHISQDFATLLMALGGYTVAQRGEVYIKVMEYRGQNQNSKIVLRKKIRHADRKFDSTNNVQMEIIVNLHPARHFIVGLCALNPGPDWTYRDFDVLTSASATTIAFEDLYLNGMLSRNITFSVIWNNAIEENEGAGAVANLIATQNADVIIGSPLSEVIKPMAHFTTYWNLPHLSWSATSPDLTDKETFKTLVRTLAPFNSFGKGFVGLFRAFKWKRAGIIYYTWGTTKYAADAILQHFSRANIYIAEVVMVDWRMTDITIQKALLQLTRTFQFAVIILSVYNTRSFMLKACDVGMCNGNYVFINPTYISTKTDTMEWKTDDDEDNDRARTAFRHLLKVTYASWSSEAHAQKVAKLRTLVPIKMAELPFNNSFALDRNDTGDFFVPYLYAAAYTYGIWLNYSITNNIDPRDGLRFRKYTPNISFDGIESHVSYNENGDRESQFWIMDFTEPDGNSRIVALIDESKPHNEALTIWKPFNWQTADNAPPMDAPICGFYDELCPEDNGSSLYTGAWQLLVILSLTYYAHASVILFMSFQFFICRKKQIEIATLNTLWKIDYDEIVFWNSNNGISSRVRVHHNMRGLIGCASVGSCKTNDSHVSYRFTKHGEYRGQVVAIKPAKCDVILTRDEKLTLLKMKQINYDNVNQFVGGCLEHPNACVLFTYCERGSLMDILEDDNIKIDWMFKLSFIGDIIKGMMHIQSSRLKSHGRLKSSNCVIDKRWILKITDYGIANFLKPHPEEDINDNANYISLLWTAPELLRQDQPPANGTQPGDVYSFGIILHEIIYRDGTFPTPMLTPKDVIERVREGSSPPFRPEIPGDAMNVNQMTVEFMQNCWAEQPEYRPTFSAAKSHMRQNYRGMNRNLIDTVLKKLETYANNLESLVDHRTAELTEEKKKTEKLLYQMLPRVVAEKLKCGGKVAPEVFESVSIFFSDIVGFTQISALSSPIEVIDLLNDLYTLFDDIIAEHEVYKVETIGDAYMVASGLPSRNGIQHAVEISEMSLNFITALNGFRIKHMPKQKLMIRIGLHTGSCCAGIVGMTMPRYCLFGDSVNTASRMESNGEAQKIHISQDFATLLMTLGGYTVAQRGEVYIKKEFIIGLCAHEYSNDAVGRWMDVLISASAIPIAVDDLHQNGVLQRDTAISLVWSTPMSPAQGAGAVVNLITEQGVDVIIGSPNSLTTNPMAHLTTFWNIPHLSWSATSPVLTDKKTFKTLVRTIAPFDSFGEGFAGLFKAFNWKRTGVIYWETSIYGYAADAIFRYFLQTDIHIAAIALTEPMADDSFIKSVLLRMKSDARIIIICTSTQGLRRFMLKACELDMCNGEYVFLHPSYMDFSTESRKWKVGDEMDEMARLAYRHLLDVTYAKWSSDKHAKQVAKLRAEVPIRMTKPPFNSSFAIDRNITGDMFTPYLYGAVYTYGLWLNYSLTNNLDPRDGTRFREYSTNITFESIEGNVSYDANGDRESQFWVLDFSEENGTSRIVALIDQARPDGETLTIWEKPRWMTPDGEPPPDAPPCGFHGELCDELEGVYWLSSFICCIFVHRVIIPYMICRKKQIENATLNTLWKIDYKEVDLQNFKHGLSRRNVTSYLSMTSSKGDGSHLSHRFGQHGTYRGQLVTIKPVNCDFVILRRDEKLTLTKMRQINNDNINPFIGGCIDAPNICVLFSYCERGSLKDILEDDAINLDWMFKLSFIKDTVNGMLYIQSSRLKCHGKLKSTNCVVDKRWILKITDYGIGAFIKYAPSTDPDDIVGQTAMLWTAPELLREASYSVCGTQAGDVYSFGIILHEILYREGTFPAPMLILKEVIDRVRAGGKKPFRPEIFTNVSDANKNIVDLMQKCWEELPENRLTFPKIKAELRKTFKGKDNLIDTVLKKLETYASNLEDLVEKRTAELTEEKKKTEKLLYQMLPPVVAEKLKSGLKVAPEVFESVSVFFSDIVGFTTISAQSEPIQVVDLLNDLYTLFDDIIALHDVYKVETIGDAYMVVSGLPNRNEIRHAAQISEMSLNFITALKGFKIKHMPDRQLSIRVGLHSGSCCAGIVGLTMPRYCLFGDTVNTASRMESNGEGK
ncbi:hypothetical protein ScPMuIL_006846 [Solemya velum]